MAAPTVIAMRPHLPRAAALAVTATCAALLAACSSSSSSTTTSSRSGTTASTLQTTNFDCSKVPASEVNTALGTSVGAPTSESGGSATSCTYSSTSPIQTVIVRVDPASSAGTFAAEQAQVAAQGQAVTPVSGVGDGAYATSLSGGGFTTNTFAVRRGTLEVQVNGPGTPAQTQAFAVALVGRL
jgi:hypothetical protein